MKAVISQKDGVYMITFTNEDYKDIFVVDEIYLHLKEEENYEDL